MKFDGFTHPLTGVLIPVFSLKTKNSLGTGEFADLVELGRWVKAAGMDIIQLLPVNDTGGDPSPYSALSAYALHPLFIRLAEVPEYATSDEALKSDLDKGVKSLKALEKKERLDYHKVQSIKLELLYLIFQKSRTGIKKNADFQAWIDKNPWVKEYAVFRSIKQQNEYRSWKEWTRYRDVGREEILRLWDSKELSDTNLFYAWVQFRLEEQFLRVATELKEMGIVLKGDIPILMNEDSADVWAHRDIFHLGLRAGAPPDMFAELGQNWGFPVYNWEALELRDYDWWRLRLKQADKFYQAYRIDHVLGFFRIWSVPEAHREGILGYFSPSRFIHRHDLHTIGFDDGRIKWLSEPHIYNHQIQNAFGMQSLEVVARCFTKLGNEDLYLFRDEIRGEKDILALPFDDFVKNMLLEMYRDRSLIQVGPDEFSAAWTFRSCSRYQSLYDHEKHLFEELVSRRGWESEQLWEGHGHKLLSFMKNTVDMLTCAEDLGVVPDCVPRVLAGLEILGLKIPRWARRWGEPGDPYIPHDKYPAASVCAPSVHDTSTLREWWEYEDGREDFWNSLGLAGPCPVEYDSTTAEQVIGRLLDAGSQIVVFQIQDLFALEDELRVEDPRSERVNIPGTVQESNWSYRIPIKLEQLGKNGGFTAKIRQLLASRKDRKTG